MAQYTLRKNIAQRIDFLEAWGKVQISVSGPNTVFISDRKETLEMNGPTGTTQGAPYTQANTNPPKEFSWIGELWAIASADQTLVDFTIPRKRNET